MQRHTHTHNLIYMQLCRYTTHQTNTHTCAALHRLNYSKPHQLINGAHTWGEGEKGKRKKERERERERERES